MFVFTHGRLKSGWSHSRVRWHFFVRGCILFVVGRLVNFSLVIPFVEAIVFHKQIPIMNGIEFTGVSLLAGSFQVMLALGLSMIVCGFLVPYIVSICEIRMKDLIFRRRATRILFGVDSEPLLGDNETFSNHGRPMWNVYVAPIIIAICAFGSIILENYFIVSAQLLHHDNIDSWPMYNAPADTLLKVLWRVIVYPGNETFIGGASGSISYPLLGWLPLALMGMGAGVCFRKTRSKSLSLWLLLLGLFGICCFMVIRFAPLTYLNYRGPPRGDHVGPGNGILALCKYPPDLPFISLTMGLNCLLLALCVQLDDYLHHSNNKVHLKQSSAFLSPLTTTTTTTDTDEPFIASDSPQSVFSALSTSADSASRHTEVPMTLLIPHSSSVVRSLSVSIVHPIYVFGKTPLFFYLLHWWMLMLFSALLFNIRGSNGLREPLNALPLMLCLVLMLFVCRRFLKFKSSTSPQSLWRLL